VAENTIVKDLMLYPVSPSILYFVELPGGPSARLLRTMVTSSTARNIRLLRGYSGRT